MRNTRRCIGHTHLVGGHRWCTSGPRVIESHVRARPRGFPAYPLDPLIIAPSESLEASLFFSVATNPAPIADRLESYRATQSFDWDRLIAFALLENAVTVVDERIASLPESLLPFETRERIARLALVWTLKLKLLEQRLYESVRLLSDAGIEVMLLKGAASALTIYRRFEDRPMADIDLLVDASRAREAFELMQKNGWMADTAGHPADAWDTHHHLPPLSDMRGSGLRLELHTAPIPPGHPFRFELAEMEANTQLLNVEGIEVRALDLHMHAIHTAIHFAWGHRFVTGGTNAFRDLSAIERTAGFSWKKFVALSHQTGSETCCYWTLRLARSLTDLPVPDDVLTALAPSLSEPLLFVLERHLSQLVLRSPRACPSATLRHRLWAFALQTDGTKADEALQWDTEVRANPSRPTPGVRRVLSHVRRIRAWSMYVTSLLATFPG